MEKTNEYLNYVFSLLETPGIGSKTIYGILEEADFSLDKVKDFVNQSLNSKLINFRKEFNSELTPNRILLCNKREIGIIPIWSEEYPENLKNISDPPIFLFYKGQWDKNLFDSSITIVGTRKPTNYGIQYTKKITSDLVQSGLATISGMAFGIDKIAHEETINNNGKTIAVLAVDPSSPSPQANSKIYKSILESGGLILSEFLPGEAVSPGMFAVRNRIVAGLSKSTLVIEAGQDSGSLITADLAFHYNRQVFALPGRVDMPFSKGTNHLIQSNKAKLICDANDILNELGYSKSKINIDNLANLSEVEIAILKLIQKTDGANLEEISVQFIGEDVASICTILEINGIIKKLSNGNYILNS